MFDRPFAETTIAIIRNMEAFVVVSAAAIYIIVEGGTMLAERYLRRRFAEGVAQGKDEANETWKRILDAHPDKTAAEIRRMMDNGELPTDA